MGRPQALALPFDELGADTGSGRPPVVVVHGLFGSRSNWRPIAREVAKTRRVLVVDVRNHGSAPWDNDMSYAAMAADFEKLIDAHTDGEAVVIGHSMGGKAALSLALNCPEKVSQLIIADIAPVDYSGRRHLGLIEAMERVDLSTATRRSQAETALAEQGIDSVAVRQFLLQNLVRTESGDGYRWRINLPVLRQSYDTIRSWPAIDRSPYPGPALLLRGATSDYVSEAGIEKARTLLTDLDVETVNDAGHWLHAENPSGFLAQLLPAISSSA